MKLRKIVTSILLSISLASLSAYAEVPPIDGSPAVISPEGLLDWPLDFPGVTPTLTEPTSNRLNDLHGQIGQCDIALTTSGNYHMALKDLWPIYLDTFAAGLNIRTWFYTTSPPIAPSQIANGVVQFGNLNALCTPQVAVGPASIMNDLIQQGVTDGEPVPIIRNNGNVILVKKGNPRNVHTIWDLGKPNVTVVTPNPDMEPGSFKNFSGSIFNIASNDLNAPAGTTATELFDSIFNQPPNKTCHTGPGRGKKKCKWVSGKRIMHREIPWAISSGNADAAVIFYHLALYFTRVFPDKFEIVPLGGTVDDPQPVLGNNIGELSAVRIDGPWSPLQRRAQARLMEALSSPEFTAILATHGINRP